MKNTASIANEVVRGLKDFGEEDRTQEAVQTLIVNEFQPMYDLTEREMTRIYKIVVTKLNL